MRSLITVVKRINLFCIFVNSANVVFSVYLHNIALAIFLSVLILFQMKMHNDFVTWEDANAVPTDRT